MTHYTMMPAVSPPELVVAWKSAGALLAKLSVADMVAIGTAREMGCLMTGIILCGRIGAAFAAQLGTMKVNYL